MSWLPSQSRRAGLPGVRLLAEHLIMPLSWLTLTTAYVILLTPKGWRTMFRFALTYVPLDLTLCDC